MFLNRRPSKAPGSWGPCIWGLIGSLVIALVLISGYFMGYHEGTSKDYIYLMASDHSTTTPSHSLSTFPLAASHCSDSCIKAKDGICDEGRIRGNSTGTINSPALVSCDLGTDCSDCGPFHGSIPPWPEEGGPISYLRSINKSLYTRHTTTSPNFLMPITLHSLDPDVSAMVWHYGALEGGITRVVHEILSDGRCLESNKVRTVVDVGANLGYFSLYAAKYGCQVLAYEPIKLFRAYLYWGIAVNGLGDLVKVISHAISDRAQPQLPIGVPKDNTYWGLASTFSLNLHPHETERVEHVSAVRLDRHIPEASRRSILLMKIDVEGYEPEVLLSAEGLFKSDGVENVLLEYSPGIAERHKNFTLLKLMPETLLGLLKQGFAAAHLPGFGFSTPWPPKTMPDTYSDPLPHFDEVTIESLQLDVRAAEMRKATEKDVKNCAVPPELKKFGVWSSCSEFVYAAHPKGFRSAFGYNTNIWLSRRFERRASPVNSTRGSFAATTGKLFLSGPKASLFAPDQDMKVWASQLRPGAASGGMKCEQIGSSHKVIFHCPCLGQDPECIEQQKAVQDLLDQGKMPMQDW